MATAAGVLLTLCKADIKHRELICKSKVGASSACQVLHGCMADPQAVPRHVVALLTCLVSDSAVSYKCMSSKLNTLLQVCMHACMHACLLASLPPLFSKRSTSL